MSRRGGLCAALALGTLTLVACGKKGPPVAPEQRFPAVPTALAASIDDRSVVVTWNLPGARIDGTPLKDLAETKLFRREDADDGPLKPAMLTSGRIAGYDEIASLRPDRAAPGSAWTGSVRWVDRQRLTFGRRYTYVATAVDASGRSSPPSARKAVTFLAAPEPPGGVQAAAGDRQVGLRWNASAAFADGTPIEGEIRYLILRGSADGPMTPVTPEPVPGTSYTDTGLANDTEYRYAVRGVRLDPRAVAAGAPSIAVAATPTAPPPRPPGNLTAVAFPGIVRLAWSPSPDATVALYAVYRGAAAGGLERIGTTAATNPTYADRTVQSGVTYRYVITAIDNAREPKESVRSAETTVAVP